MDSSGFPHKGCTLMIPRRIQSFVLNTPLDYNMDSSGFEPEAPALQGRCSTRLSYEPIRLNFIVVKKYV